MIEAGKSYGLLTAIAPSESHKRKWLFKCSCGNKKEIDIYNVLKGLSRSCDCARRKNRSGEAFGKLTVTSFAKKEGIRMFWNCVCECGSEICVRQDVLTRGGKTGKISCGCSKGESHITHGLSKGRPYRIWIGMKARCLNSNKESYENYGARGIKVCPQWINSFEAFWSDVKAGYEDTLSLDRIDNDGDYEPGNVRWGNQELQANNMRSNVYFQWNDKKLTLPQICRLEGVNYRRTYNAMLSGQLLSEALDYAKNAPKHTKKMMKLNRGKLRHE